MPLDMYASPSGQTRTLCCDASKISCASMPTRVSPAPSWQTNSSGPLGGSGHAHHRQTIRCELPPPPRDCRIGPVGSASPSDLPLMTVLPSASCKLIWKDCRSASTLLRAPGTGSPSKPGTSGRMRRVTKNSKPLLKAHTPVIAIAVCSDRSNRRALIGTRAGNSVSGGSHGRGALRASFGTGGRLRKERMASAFHRAA
jgi:hypothetical protein